MAAKTKKPRTLLEIYLSQPMFGPFFSYDDGKQTRLELGMKMPMPFKTSKGDFQELVVIKQITVRDVEIPARYQKKGWLTELLKHLMKDGTAVQIESVQPQWFKKRLEESPYWIRQTLDEYKDFNPSYVRLKPIVGKSIFGE
jgi:hypothetical protein